MFRGGLRPYYGLRLTPSGLRAYGGCDTAISERRVQDSIISDTIGLLQTFFSSTGNSSLPCVASRR